MLHISERGIDLIKSFEGCHLQGYICPAGVPTIGYGYTGKVNGKTITTATKITQMQAEALLTADLAKFENHVRLFDAKYHWNQNEFDALVSFAYNVGSINQLTQNKKRTKTQIASAMLSYNKASGKILIGLTRRRKAEMELFLQPIIMNEAGKGEEEVKIETIKMIVNGKKVSVRRILEAGTNYVAIRDVGTALGCEVTAKGNIPVLNTK